MKIRTILEKKGTDIYSISADATLADMVKYMLSLHIGSLLVLDEDGKISGIVTERDFLRNIASHHERWESVRIGDVMSTDVFTADINDSLEYVMAYMTKKRVRHLPVLDSGEVAGMLSKGDIANAALEQTSYQNELLKRYINNWPEEEQAPSKH